MTKVLNKISAQLEYTYAKPDGYADCLYNLYRIWTWLDAIRLYMLCSDNESHKFRAFVKDKDSFVDLGLISPDNKLDINDSLLTLSELITLRREYDSYISEAISNESLKPCKNLEDINSFLRNIISDSKFDPKMYANSHHGIEIFWDIIDIILCTIYNVDDYGYRMGIYELTVEIDCKGKKWNIIGSHGMNGHIRFTEPNITPELFHERMVQLRNQFEEWQKRKLLKDYPRLAIYF